MPERVSNLTDEQRDQYAFALLTSRGYGQATWDLLLNGIDLEYESIEDFRAQATAVTEAARADLLWEVEAILLDDNVYPSYGDGSTGSIQAWVWRKDGKEVFFRTFEDLLTTRKGGEQ